MSIRFFDAPAGIGATAFARTLLDDVDAPTARGTLGLGTAAVEDVGHFALASHAHDAAAITSGVLATARLGSGTADSTTFLRGDGTWQAISVSGYLPLAGGTLTGAFDLKVATVQKFAVDADGNITCGRVMTFLGVGGDLHFNTQNIPGRVSHSFSYPGHLGLARAGCLSWASDATNANAREIGINRVSSTVIEVDDCTPGSCRDFKLRHLLDENGDQVIGTRGAAVADATGAGDVVAQLNALLARARAHGWIAT